MNSKLTTITPLSALQDNYIWVILNHKKQAIIIDPGDASPILTYLHENSLDLVAIMITHHHWDHTNGIAEIINAQGKLPIYGSPDSKCLLVNNFAFNSIAITDFPPIKVMPIPGHTLDHTAYICEDNLFCGDTLFSAGCGKIFEGNANMMFNSLQKLAGLADETQVYYGHEYTRNNLQFAQSVDPNNHTIREYITALQTERSMLTLPSTIGFEKQINPFLRCHTPEMQLWYKKLFKNNEDNPETIFTALRKAKDNF